MNCDILASTGADPLPLIAVAVSCIALGLIAVLVLRRRRVSATAAVAAVVLVAVIGLGSLTPAPAFAVATECSVSSVTGTSLTLTQSSVVEGMAPGVAPTPLAGIVANAGGDNVHVDAVAVSIASVTKSADAVPGSCGAADYVLVAPLMPVDTTLTPGGTTPFTGAAIGFNDRSTNQDACKKATLTLRYVVSAE